MIFVYFFSFSVTRLKDLLGDLNSFYVIETYDYRFCNYHNKQADMALPASVEDLVN